MVNSQKWLGEGAMGLLSPGSENEVAPVQNMFRMVQKTLGRLLLPELKLPFAPSPNHFWSFGLPRMLSGTSVWRPQSCYTLSRIVCRITFLQNQRCRAKIALHPHKSRCRTFSPDPPIALSSHSQQTGGAAGWWWVLRHFWIPKTDRATGGYRSYNHTSRATVCN